MLARLSSIPVGTKLKVSFAWLIAIILVFAFSYYQQTDDDIHFSRQELYGNAFIGDLRPLLRDIPEHRRLTHAVELGNGTLAGQLPAIRASIGDTFEQLHRFNPAWAADIQIGT